jgi:hypothetical protein
MRFTELFANGEGALGGPTWDSIKSLEVPENKNSMGGGD